jgi:DNA-binding PadR family transcriptional regulator
MSTTRLLVLGVVRIFQPVHGYFVRRELLSWRADTWAAINPGSIYGQLKGLSKDAFIEALPGGSGDKTRYRLTVDGETEFQTLLREHLWNVDIHHPGSIIASAAFLWTIPRDEALEILDGRLAQLHALRAQSARLAKVEHDPPMTVELSLFTLGLAESQITWLEGLIGRVRAGEYAFEGEQALLDQHARMADAQQAEKRAAQD